MLQKQNISLTLDASIDTKRDEFLTDGAVFLTQENCRFDKIGAIKKRPGLTGANSGLSSLVSGGFLPKRIVTDSKQLFISGEASELGAARYFNSTWAQNGSEIVNGNTTSAQIALNEVFGGDALCQSAYVDYYDGIYAIACDRARNGGLVAARFPILYIYDGQKYITAQDFTISAPTETITNPRCAIIQASGVKYVIVACEYIAGASNYLKVVCFNMAGTQVYETDTLITTATGSNVAICASADRTQAYIAKGNGATSIRCQIANQSSVTTSTTVSTTASITGVEDIAVGTDIVILCKKTDHYPVVRGCTAAFVGSWERAESNASLGFGVLSNPGENIMGIGSNGSSYYYSFYYVSGSVRRSVVMTGTSAGFSSYATEYNVQPISRPILYDGAYYLAVKSVSGSTFSSMGVTKISTSTPIGFYFISSAAYQGIDTNRNNMGGGIIVSGGKFVAMPLIATRTDFVNTIFSSAIFSSAALYEVDLLNSEPQYGSVCNLGDTLALYAGQASFFDGSGQKEMGFYFPPSLLAVGSGTGGTITAGTYNYKVLFEIQDDQGNILRSEESDAVQVTTTGSTSSVALTVRISNWIPNGASVTVLRTTNAGTIYYVLRKDVLPLSTNAYTYTDVTPDSSITSSTVQSYVTGGLLENTPPPPAKHACVHQNRVWLVPADERDKVYYSKKQLNGEMTSFSVFQFIEQASTIPNVRDNITAVASLGDKLIMFRENSIYWVAGDGVNEAGTGSTLTEPELLTMDIGCTENRSVITTPVGVMFKSNKGIYLIDPGLGVKYVGDRVEAYNSEEIIDSVLLPNTQKNSVVFATSSRLLVYDYSQDKWSVDTISSVQCIGQWDNRLIVVKSDGSCAIEGTDYQDSFASATDIQMKVSTGWMKLSGIQDFGRVWRVLILGRWYSSHALTAKVYYDYSTSYSETYTISQATTITPYQFNLHLKKQKCESMKIEIYDTGSGKSIELTGLTLEVGVKKGTMKLPATRKL